MDKNAANISAIETWLNSVLDNKVSDNTFFGMPQTIDSSWNDMVVVECQNAITDYNAYCGGSVTVFLYAKPFASGKKNVAQLSALEKKLNDAIANAQSSTYRISRRETFTDYDETNKMHFNVVVLNILIL